MMVLQSTPRSKIGSILIFVHIFFVSASFGQISLPSDSIDLGLGGNNVISGTVNDSAGRLVETRVTVRLATMTRGDVVTVANEKGYFSFRGIPAGTYTVYIEKEAGFEPFTQAVNIIQFRGAPGQVYSVNIRLKPKARTEGKPGVIDSELAKIPEKAREYYFKGSELSKEGKYNSAIEQFQLAITEYPEFILAHNELGVQYLRLNDLRKADEAFEAALKLKSDSFEPLVNRGIVLVGLKRFEDAELGLRKAVELNNQSAVARYFFGQALANLGKFEDAANELRSALSLDSLKMNEARRLLAIIYSSQGNKKLAAEELKKYLVANPMAPDAEEIQKTIRKLNETDNSIK